MLWLVFYDYQSAPYSDKNACICGVMSVHV